MTTFVCCISSGEFDEDENIYESMYLQPLPGDNEYDSDDISWSSDEFESYEDSIHNEAAPKVEPEVAQPATVIMGPPASRVRKIHVAQGLEEPQVSLMVNLIPVFSHV